MRKLFLCVWTSLTIYEQCQASKYYSALLKSFSRCIINAKHVCLCQISALLHRRNGHEGKCQFSSVSFGKPPRSKKAKMDRSPSSCFWGSVLVLVRGQNQEDKSPCSSDSRCSTEEEEMFDRWSPSASSVHEPPAGWSLNFSGKVRGLKIDEGRIKGMWQLRRAAIQTERGLEGGWRVWKKRRMPTVTP